MGSIFKAHKPNIKISFILLYFLFILLCTGCQKKNTEFKTNEFFAMDTWMSVQISGDFTDEEAQSHLQAIETMIRELENTLSVTLQSSELYKLNNSCEETIELKSRVLAELLTEALTLENLTNRAFCPRLYKISSEWGFTTGKYKIPEDDLLKTLLEEIMASEVTIKDNTITRTFGIMFDLGGIAKGYATDCVVDYLKANDIKKAIINLGGNIYIHGSNNNEGWRVGITDPFGNDLFGIVKVIDACVITSGSYERYFEHESVRYHHIIDSTTGYPADNELVSVTIISDDASYADALSTALFVMGLDKSIDFWHNNEGFEAIFVTKSHEVYYTEGLKDTFSCDKDNYSTKQINRN